jgi:hypothetical protein
MVLNVNLGLSSYGYLNLFQQMNVILQSKRLLIAKYLKETSESKKQKLKKEIKKLE